MISKRINNTIQGKKTAFMFDECKQRNTLEIRQSNKCYKEKSIYLNRDETLKLKKFLNEVLKNDDGIGNNKVKICFN